MKRLTLTLAAMLFLVAIALPALAGRIAERQRVVVPVGGSVTVSDYGYIYTSAELRRVWIEDAGANTTTSTVSRVFTLGGTVYTQQLASVASTLKKGNAAPSAHAALTYGDTLLYQASASTGATNAVLILDWDILRPR